MYPKTHEEMKYTTKLPYTRAIGSLMYVMVCTRLHIAYSTGVVRGVMIDPKIEN
jgi:hypothetical protein